MLYSLLCARAQPKLVVAMPEPAAKLGTLKPDQLATRIGRIKAKREKDEFQRHAQRDMMKAAKAKSLSMPKKVPLRPPMRIYQSLMYGHP